MQKQNLTKNPYCIIVETCGGLNKLEELQQHDLEELFRRSSHILLHYFEATPMNDEATGMVMPEQNQDAYQFNAPSNANPNFQF